MTQQGHEIEVYEEGDRALAPVVPLAAALAQSDVMAQLDAAHRYPRSIGRFMQRAKSMIVSSRETAESCMYAVPRGGKMIKGPSIRLAEIASSAYTNIQVGARIVDIGEEFVTAQGVAWDMETNLKTATETQRRITNRDGRRYNEDMIGTTCNAAMSIARRNAIFQVIPRAFIDQLYEAAREFAVGTQKTLAEQREVYISRIEKKGITRERVLLRLGKATVEDVDLADLETLAGLGTAIKNGDITLDEAFPAVVAVATPEQEGQRVSMCAKAAAAPPSDEPPPIGEPVPPVARAASNETVASLRKVFMAELAQLPADARADFWRSMPAGYTDVQGVQECKELTPMREVLAALRAFAAS